MGARAQVQIIDNQGKSIFLYTHWGAEEIIKTVQRAMIRGRDRWNDDEYFTRIIFSEMIKDNIDGLMGYGIGHLKHDDIQELVIIDLKKQTVETKGDDDFQPEIPFEIFVSLPQ